MSPFQGFGLTRSGIGDPPGSDKQRSKMGHAFTSIIPTLGQGDLRKVIWHLVDIKTVGRVRSWKLEKNGFGESLK